MVGIDTREELILYEQLDFLIAHSRECKEKDCTTCELYHEGRWVLLGVFDTEERSIEKHCRYAIKAIQDALAELTGATPGNYAALSLRDAQVRLKKALGE